MKRVEFTAALTKNCTLNLSQVAAASPQELATAEDKGPVPKELLSRIIDALDKAIEPLPDVNRKLALENFKAINVG